ncbi:MAG: hypothetical protein Q8P67_10865, partial [archaeon]|nr:hypothetical protein [archaeon]
MHHDEDADLIPLNHRQRRAEQYKQMGKTGEVRTISRLFVKGVPKEWDETKLADVFSEVGPVRRALLMRTSSGESKGCGLVSYAMVEDAATAMSRFNAMKVPGTSIKLLVEVAKKIERKEHGEAQGDDGVAESSEPQQQKSRRPRLSQEDKARTIFIENLPESVSVRRLRRHADRCGSVEEFVYPDKGGLVKSAQGAVTLVQSAKIRFATIKEAEQASDYFFGKVLSKKKHPGFKTKAYQLIAGRRCRLIVRNLPFKARADILQKHFEQCGQVTEVNIPSKPDGTKCGFGFVQFRHPSEAAAAIGKLNASTLLDRSIVVDWSLPKDKFEALKSKQQAEGASQRPPEQFKAAPLPSDDATDSDDGEDAQDEVDDAQDEGVEEADSEEEAPVKGKKASDLWTPAEPPKPNLQIRRKLDRDIPGASLFIRNISFETTEEDLKEAFEAFAPVRRVLLVRDPITKLPRGNGFVHFRTAEDASRVLEETKDIPSDTKLPIPKKKASPTTHLLIQHLGSSLVVDGRRLILLPSLKREEVKDVTEKRGKTVQSEDSRGLRLAKEGFIEEGTPAAEGLTQSDLNRRKTAWVEKKQKLLNPNFFVSSTRLSIRNLPVSLDEKALKQLVIKQTQQYLIDAGGQPKEVRKRRIVQQVKLPRSSTETETNADLSDLSVKGKP